MHPRLYEGPRMVKPPIVQIAGMLRARSAGIDDRCLDLDRRRGRPAPVPAAERRRLGRAALARHGPDQRPLVGRRRRCTEPSEIDTEDYDAEGDGQPRRSAKALRFWGRPDAELARRRKELQRLRRPGRGRRPRATGSRSTLPGAAPERAADPDRHRAPTSRPREPGTAADSAAAASSPAPSWRGARSPRRAGAARRSSAGMPAPGRHRALTRRSFLLRTGGLALSVYGASLLSRRRSPRASPRRRAAGQGARLGLPRGRHRRALDALAGRRRRLPAAAPAAAAARPERGRPGPRTRACSGIPRRRRCISSTARARSRSSRAIGYAGRRSVALHLPPLLGGRRARPADANTGWLGRLLDVVGTDDNPLAGPLAGRLARRRASPPRRSRSRRPGGPATTSGHRASGAMSRS